jgi:hypothetical protein
MFFPDLIAHYTTLKHSALSELQWLIEKVPTTPLESIPKIVNPKKCIYFLTGPPSSPDFMA